MADLKDLSNEKLEELLKEYKENNSLEKLTELAEELRISQVHMPCKKNGNNGVASMIIKGQDGKMLIPIFTSKNRVDGKVPNGTEIAIVPFTEVNRIAANEIETKHLDGIIINPSYESIIFNVNFIMKFHITEQESKKKGVKIPLDFTKAAPPVDNKELEIKMEEFVKEEDKDKKNLLFNQILNELRISRLIMPLGVNDKGGNSPLISNNKDTGEKMMITYTDPEFAAKRHENARFGAYEFGKAIEVALKIKKEVDGMCIITEKVTINLKTPLLEKIKDANEQAKKQQVGAQTSAPINNQVNPLISEQVKFTMETLPKLLEKRGQKLVTGLVELREEYINELYENAFYKVEEYPYTEADFTVTAITAAENTDAIEIEFPKKAAGSGSALRVYIIWNSETANGRYFAIVKNDEGPCSIIEINNDQRKDHGVSEIETNEMSTIFDIAEIW